MDERSWMKEKMNRWGIGPIFAFLSIAYGMMTLFTSRCFYPAFQISFVPDWLMVVLGIALIGFGVPFFIVAIRTVMRAYNADELVTDGIFKCCRHPLYGSWVVLIVPGICFFANSWIAFTTPVFMYLILRQLVKNEEAYLESVFGSEYREYKESVPCIIPFGRIKPFH